MSFQNRFITRFLVVVACALTALAPTSFAQVTTGTLTGSVLAADGSALPGVTVEAVHVPTGTRYSDVTGGEGRFTMPNVRVGGPYRVSANLEGFTPFERSGIQVGLGTPTEVPVTLGLAAVAEAITVTATADEIINPNRTGSQSTVSEETIESLPTVNRSLQDFARTNPYFRVDPSDISATRINVAGRNNRYNQIQIDGAVNNDLFGLSDTGTPGGVTGTNPISIDAIEQLQLVVSPYDVRQGGFTGGGMNAVTRSGTNDWRGTAFASMRSPDLVGEGPGNCNRNIITPVGTDCTPGTKLADFESNQYGASFGGPVLRDRLFFFLSGELNRRTAPTGTSANAQPGTINFSRSGFDAARLRQSLIDRYNYDPGDLGDISGSQDSDLLFARFDWNANASNQVTLRHNYVEALNDVIADRTSAARFRFPTSIYSVTDETNSTVAQVNSIFGANMYNEARVGLQTIRDNRALPVRFPSIEIGGSNQNAILIAGSERFSAANKLDQDILEITDDFTWTRGNHTIVIGTHNEFFEFKNLFMSDAVGSYFFPTQEAWDTNAPTEYRITFATGDDPFRPTAFEAGQYGFYVNDSWRVNNSITLSMGLRADIPTFPDSPSQNPTVANLLGYNTSDIPSESAVFSPRFGFNWNPGGVGSQQVRGGIGIFAGRTPYVWISNAYAGSGVEQVSLTCRQSDNCPVPQFNPNVDQQPRSLGSAPALTVDLVDPDFEFPRILRGTLAYDRDLFFGVRGTIEGVWSQTQQDVFYYNVNLRESGNTSFDGRPVYTRVSTGMSDAYLLTNTSNGDEFTGTIVLTRPFTNGLVLGGSYAYQDANSAFDATSSRAVSNWRFRHTQGDIFDDDVATSAFEVENRFNAYLSYNLTTGPLAHTVGLYWNAQSGRPYSIMLGGSGSSINGDFNTSNDLLYVPGSATEVVLCPSTAGNPTATNPCGTVAALPYDVLANYLEYAGIDPTAGRILERYESNEPWSRQLDLHYELGLPIRRVESQVTFDMTNLLNFFDEEYGNVKFVANQNVTPVNFVGLQPGTNTPVYREASTTFRNGARAGGSLNPGAQFSSADLRSRWTARVGVRVSF